MTMYISNVRVFDYYYKKYCISSTISLSTMDKWLIFIAFNGHQHNAYFASIYLSVKQVIIQILALHGENIYEYKEYNIYQWTKNKRNFDKSNLAWHDDELGGGWCGIAKIRHDRRVGDKMRVNGKYWISKTKPKRKKQGIVRARLSSTMTRGYDDPWDVTYSLEYERNYGKSLGSYDPIAKKCNYVD